MAAPRPPFRADHVGSLLRPAALKALRVEKDAGRVSAAQLTAAEDASIRDAVRLQEDVGLQGITDGEHRRMSWHMDFLLRLGGWTTQGQTIPVTFHGKSGELHFTRPDLEITDRVTRPTPIFVDGFRFLKSVVTRTPKLTIPSPNMLYSQVGRAGIDSRVYPDLDAFVEDTAAAYRAEIADLYAAGCRYLQLDDVSLAYLCDEDLRTRMKARGEDPDAQLALSVTMIRATLRDKPADMVICTQSSAAATSARRGARRAATRGSRRPSSRRCRTTASSWSSTTRARATSRRCDTSRDRCALSSVSSPARRGRSRIPTR
jgi:5-methyltetrahydropteroyltriglutamate--homocysteine methyltransferase